MFIGWVLYEAPTGPSWPSKVLEKLFKANVENPHDKDAAGLYRKGKASTNAENCKDIIWGEEVTTLPFEFTQVY